ncbi:MAG: hypothetical protein CVU65_00660 [Deltaproteobacteria bacterium HGW-Deltaproteobacteria-22]|jgi:hypothetical protein|nr:MAG: hypothetical protein CVU65_00660 [Deltaproteobacteria bacterium HGW-Deltaproteobacteria-22]
MAIKYTCLTKTNPSVNRMIFRLEWFCAGRCGDKTVDAGDGEQCDDLDFGGATCETLGFYQAVTVCGDLLSAASG